MFPQEIIRLIFPTETLEMNLSSVTRQLSANKMYKVPTFLISETRMQFEVSQEGLPVFGVDLARGWGTHHGWHQALYLVIHMAKGNPPRLGPDGTPGPQQVASVPPPSHSLQRRRGELQGRRFRGPWLLTQQKGSFSEGGSGAGFLGAPCTHTPSQATV